jgi:putative acetyltransferase
MELDIRTENRAQARAVEELTREAFWNVHVPGCNEHFVLHQLRQSADFVPELDFVAVRGERVIGNIVYSLARVLDGAGKSHRVLTFGPLSVHPDFQRQGIGSALVRHSLAVAKTLGQPAVCIYGDPRYYHRFGFRCAERFDIRTSDGKFAVALLALELSDGALRAIQGRFVESPAFEVNEIEFEGFERTFPHKEKLATPSQDEFRLLASLRY